MKQPPGYNVATMNRWRFSLVEQRIEQLVEGGFARLFADRLSPRDVAVRLARAMEDAAITDTDGSLLAPNLFSIYLNADDYAQMDAHLAENLSETVVDFAHRTEMRLLTAPYVNVISSEEIPPRTVRVEASHQRLDPHETQATSPVTIPEPPPAMPEKSPRNPQLIVNGAQYIPLNRQVINIGRR